MLTLAATTLYLAAGPVSYPAIVPGGGERDEWSALDADIEQIANAGASFSSPLETGGFLKTSWAYSRDTDYLIMSDTAGFSLDAARVWLESEIAGWTVHVGLRGEHDVGYGFFGDVGRPDDLEMLEILVSREIADDTFARAGVFRAPFIASALFEENRLMFVDRTYLGERWDFYQEGVGADGRFGPVRWMASAQNGDDAGGEEVALTVRGVFDLFAEPANPEHEGAYGAPDEPALSIAGAAYYDTNTRNASAQAIDAFFTAGPFSLQGEVVDNGDGLGDLYSFGLGGSWLFLPNTEAALRYEDFERSDGTNGFRVGVNHYLIGHDVKVQATYASSDSHAPRADVDLFAIALVVSI